MAFDAALQRQIMGQWATGVSVVTTPAAGDGEPHAMTANAFTSLSLEPPLVLVAVHKGNTMHGAVKESGCFAVNMLTEEQEHLSNRFAARGPKDLSDLELRTAETGAPILADALAYLDCRLTDVLRGGDHDIFVGEIVAGDVGSGCPLLFYGGAYRQLADHEGITG